MSEPTITIMGVGNILLSDEGAGVRVVERLEEHYEFPDNVRLIDGGVLGINLMGIISEADQLIIIDVIRCNETPGTLYRMEGDQIPKRVLKKDSMHQIDLLEALALCDAIDKTPPFTVILGIEPKDIETLSVELTPEIQSRLSDLTDLVLKELDRLQVPYKKKEKR